MREVGQRRIWVSAVRLVLSDFTHTAHRTHTPAILKKQAADRTTCHWESGNINMLIILKMQTQS